MTHDPSADDALIRLGRAAHRALPDAPPEWRLAAKALARGALGPRALEQLGATVREALRTLVASVTFDSWATPALGATTRGLRSPTRQLLLRAEDREIDLRIAPAGAAFTVSGQILGRDETGTVDLAGAGRSHTATLDDLGEFHLDGIAPGTYAMTLRFVDAQVALPPLEVGVDTR